MGLVIIRAYGTTHPINLRCEYLINPIGIEKKSPSLSWQVVNKEKNWYQTAYQILVSTDPKLLSRGKSDVWDSGKQISGESVCIPYFGSECESEKRYYWAVRVWDSKDKPSTLSEPAFWEMGLLHRKDWIAKWISRKDPEEKAEWETINWIWLPGQDAFALEPKTVGLFRQEFEITEIPQDASIQSIARGNYQLFVNGKLVDTKNGWQAFERTDILEYLVVGSNNVEFKVTAVGGKPAGARVTALAGLLKITKKDGIINRYPTSEAWKSRSNQDLDWKPAISVARLDDRKMGELTGPLSTPASLFRKEFKLTKKIKTARLYVTALGSYRMFINGIRVGMDVLTPEFTEYSKRVTYQTYDVTSLVKEGVNATGAILGDGWYGSPLSWIGNRNYFGSPPNRILAQLIIKYNDGTQDKIATDESWKSFRSPILKSELYAGEYYDARLEKAGWNLPGFDHSSWSAVNVLSGPTEKLSGQVNKPVRVVQNIKPQSKWKLTDGTWLFDMGQNVVGWAKLKVNGKAGTIIKMRFAERLDTAGNMYFDNLRNATATDIYVPSGEGEETYTPFFTFHGFRYIQLTGYPGEPGENAVTVEVVSSIDELTGKISTSADLINKMWSLGIWGQRGNFISVPTDCPQRDERLGYTGDGQIFWRTGAYNYNVAPFTHKWLQDIRDEQTTEGGYTNTAPGVPLTNKKNGAPGWEDAGVIVPWTTWMQFGDKSVILESWDSMVKWMDYVLLQSKNFIRPGGRLGDWLAPGSITPNDLIGTALWAMDADKMSQMALAINKYDEAKKYAVLNANIRKAFQQKFILPDGKIGSGSQTSYLYALYTNLVPDSLKTVAIESLVKDIEKHDWHLTTGFLGTPYLLFALSENGRADVAYRLLLNETYPSWGYMIKNGATTWWERWNGDSGDPSMNSYNHYAFGSVVEWLYRAMSGINPDPQSPGFKKIQIKPQIDRSGKVTQAKAEYESVYGLITSEWITDADGSVNIKVQIPANTTAKVYIPAKTGGRITESGKEIKVTTESDNFVIDIGSGAYNFQIR